MSGPDCTTCHDTGVICRVCQQPETVCMRSQTAETRHDFDVRGCPDCAAFPLGPPEK